MLAQNFKSSSDLQITEEQKSALIKTLVLLETGKLVHVPEDKIYFDATPARFAGNFNMIGWTSHSDCGTVACIGGTAELVGGVKFRRTVENAALEELFFTNVMNDRDITPTQAARALRSYLTTGDARWDLAVEAS